MLPLRRLLDGKDWSFMRDLTWFFFVAVITAFTILFLYTPAKADDFAAHLKALQEKNAAKPKPVEAPKNNGWQTGDRSFYKGKWWTLRADGWWYADVPEPVPQPAPVAPTFYRQSAWPLFMGACRGGG